MEYTELRPGSLYNFINYVREFDLPVEDAMDIALSIESGDDVGDKETMVLVAELFNKYILKNKKIDLKYIFEEEAPSNYFKEIGTELLKDNIYLLDEIGYKLMKVFEELHNREVNKLTNIVGFPMYCENSDLKIVASLPFPYGGIYNVYKLYLPVYCLLFHLGIDLIELDDSFGPILSDEFEDSIYRYVEDYLEDNSIYRYGHLKTELSLLPISYKPLFPSSAPSGKQAHAERRCKCFEFEDYKRNISKVICEVNPVFSENIWIPEE